MKRLSGVLVATVLLLGSAAVPASAAGTSQQSPGYGPTTICDFFPRIAWCR